VARLSRSHIPKSPEEKKDFEIQVRQRIVLDPVAWRHGYSDLPSYDSACASSSGRTAAINTRPRFLSRPRIWFSRAILDQFLGPHGKDIELGAADRFAICDELQIGNPPPAQWSEQQSSRQCRRAAYWSSIGENRARASDSVIHPRSPTGKALSDADNASSSTALSLRASGGTEVPRPKAAFSTFGACRLPEVARGFPLFLRSPIAISSASVAVDMGICSPLSFGTQAAR
jgi:hypothetical protein